MDILKIAQQAHDAAVAYIALPEPRPDGNAFVLGKYAMCEPDWRGFGLTDLPLHLFSIAFALEIIRLNGTQ